MVLEQGCQVLSRRNNTANWAKFWAFFSRALVIAQHLQGLSNANALKDQLLKGEDSLNLILQDNMKLTGDNKNLEDWVLLLTNDAKGLQTLALNDEALIRSQYTEITRLWSALVDANKETKEVNAEMEHIQQKALNDVYNAHEANFDHGIWQVLHMCYVFDPKVFNISKDIYEGELVLIDDIPKEDVALSPPRSVTPTDEPQVKGVEDAEDGEQVGPRDCVS